MKQVQPSVPVTTGPTAGDSAQATSRPARPVERSFIIREWLLAGKGPDEIITAALEQTRASQPSGMDPLPRPG